MHQTDGDNRLGDIFKFEGTLKCTRDKNLEPKQSYYGASNKS